MTTLDGFIAYVLFRFRSTAHFRAALKR